MVALLEGPRAWRALNIFGKLTLVFGSFGVA
jgi:hypothetical protein